MVACEVSRSRVLRDWQALGQGDLGAGIAPQLNHGSPMIPSRRAGSAVARRQAAALPSFTPQFALQFSQHSPKDQDNDLGTDDQRDYPEPILKGISHHARE